MSDPSTVRPVSSPEGVKYTFWSLRTADAQIRRQLKQRLPTPVESWGEDPRKQRMAQFICRVLEEECGWPKDLLIPEDPVAVLFRFGNLYREPAEIIEGEIMGGIGTGPSLKSGATLGDLVDYCLRAAPDWPVGKWVPPPSPPVGLANCTSGSVFRDLQQFLSSRTGLDRLSIRPSTSLRICPAKWKNCDLINNYIFRRFGSDCVLRPRFLGFLPPIWSWLGLSLGVYLILFKGAGFGMAFVTLIFFGAFVMYLTFPRWRRGLRTFRDLVEFVMRQIEIETPSPNNSLSHKDL